LNAVRRRGTSAAPQLPPPCAELASGPARLPPAELLPPSEATAEGAETRGGGGGGGGGTVAGSWEAGTVGTVARGPLGAATLLGLAAAIAPCAELASGPARLPPAELLPPAEATAEGAETRGGGGGGGGGGGTAAGSWEAGTVGTVARGPLGAATLLGLAAAIARLSTRPFPRGRWTFGAMLARGNYYES